MNNYIVGIGAANVDVYGKSKIKIRTHYDHPADIFSNAGGVTRNILENYALLGGEAKLLTAIGDDSYGHVITDSCNRVGIDVSNVLIEKGATSGVFMQIQDENNDMYLAICDMSILNNLNSKYINDNKDLILNARAVLFDPSISHDSIEALLDLCCEKVETYCDPISDEYALKIKPYISRIDCIKPNKTELECLSGIKINNDEDLLLAAKTVIEIGVKKLFVSLGKDGILYMDNAGTCIRKKLKPVENMVNASGAGDALVATILFGYSKEYAIEDIIEYGLAAGAAAIMSSSTINPDLSLDLLNKILKENK